MKLKSLSAALTAAFALAAQAFATSDYSSWSHSRTITINPASLGLTAPVTNFPVLVRLSEAAGTFTFSESQSTWDSASVPTAPPTKLIGAGGGDIRFTDSTGTDATRTDLSYQIEKWNGTSKTAEIWVLVPSISNTTPTTFKMYWGKTGLTTPPASHSGTAVFSRANVSASGCEPSVSNGAAGACGFVTVHHLITTVTPTVGEPTATLTSATTLNLQDKSGVTDPVATDTGLIGYGIPFNGVDQAYGINASKNDSSTNLSRGNFSLSAWAYFKGTGAGRIFSKFGEYRLGTDSTGTKWEIEYDNNPFASATTGTPQFVRLSIAAGWNYVVATRTGSTMTLYVNGTTTSSTIVTGTPFTYAPVQTVSFAYDGGDGTATYPKTAYFNGTIDEPRIENVVRSPDWIRLNYATQKASVTAVSYAAAAQPVASPVSQSFSGTQPVTLSTTTAGATIYYTLDGSTPTTSSAVYGGTLSLNATTTVKAIAVGSYFGASGVMSETYTVQSVPGAPITVTDTAGNGQVIVVWAAPVSNGGSAVTKYTVTAVQDTSKHCSTTGSLTCTVTGLANGTAYSFTVTATNAVGTGASSTASALVTPTAPPGVPTAPGGAAATAGNGRAIVTWTASTANAFAITGYIVTSNPDGKTCSTTGSLTCVDSALTNGTAYTFTVVATSSAGPSTASAPSTAVTPFGLPGAPTLVSGVSGNGQVVLTWVAPASNGGTAITGYVATAVQDTSKHCATTGALTCNVTGLTNGTSYTFTATATNTAGTGAASTVSAPVIPATVPGAPTGVTGTPGTAQVTLSWTAPSVTGGSAITGYNAVAVQDTSKKCSTTGTLTCTITGLTNGTAYTFTVTATSSAGTGTPSVVSASITPASVPDAPTNVTGVGGNAQVTISWAAPVNTGGSSIIGYVATAFQDTSKHCSTTGVLTCVVTGLATGTSYNFIVVAVNAIGKSANSSASGGVTPGSTAGIYSLAGNLGLRMTASSMMLRLPELDGNAQISVMDVWGRTVWNQIVTKETREVSLGRGTSGIVPGLYILRLTVQDSNHKSRLAAESKILLTP